jgi:hypothetical protein
LGARLEFEISSNGKPAGGAVQMPRGYRFRLIAFNAVALIGLVFLLLIDKDEMLIQYGTHGARTMTVLLWAGWGVLVVFFNFLILRGLARSMRRPKKSIPSMVLDEKELTDIDKVADQIFRIRQEKPQLKDIFAQCMNQVDIAKEKQAAIRTVFTHTKSKMDDVVATIDDAVLAMCSNFNKILKRAILWTPEDASRSIRSGSDDIHRKYMQLHLNKNEEILDMCSKLISETLSYIEESDSGTDSSVSLESTTSMIRTLRAMSGAAKNPFES